MSKRHVSLLETVFVEVPEDAVPAFESALSTVCATVGLFVSDEAARIWRVEGVKSVGDSDEELFAAIAVAGLVSGCAAALQRAHTEAEGWLAKVYAAFPEQRVGQRFAVRGTHVAERRRAGRITLLVDAGLAFGSGEHGSTRGCLRALERVAYRKPARTIDMGCGSGILAMGAAALLRRRVIAVDNDPWSVRVTRQNAAMNGLRTLVVARLGNGWQGAGKAAKYDLIFANILARPLCLMAGQLAAHLAPGGTVILAGLLRGQIRAVLAAHRRQGLRLERVMHEGNWATMVLRS
jgi:ribosomal protein L11 methyltransferase